MVTFLISSPSRSTLNTNVVGTICALSNVTMTKRLWSGRNQGFGPKGNTSSLKAAPKQTPTDASSFFFERGSANIVFFPRLQTRPTLPHYTGLPYTPHQPATHPTYRHTHNTSSQLKPAEARPIIPTDPWAAARCVFPPLPCIFSACVPSTKHSNGRIDGETRACVRRARGDNIWTPSQPCLPRNIASAPVQRIQASGRKVRRRIVFAA